MAGTIRTFNVIVNPAEEGGFWAEVVELPGCASQGETEVELLQNIIEAIEACLEAGTPYGNHDVRLPEVWKVPVHA